MVKRAPYQIESWIFIAVEKSWLEFKTIKPQVDSYDTRFTILIHGIHCHHSCNELDNGTIPEAKVVTVINHARMLWRLAMAQTLAVESFFHSSIANTNKWSGYINYAIIFKCYSLIILFSKITMWVVNFSS